MEKFVYITPKNSLSKDIKINRIIESITLKVLEIPNIKTLHLNLEILKMICIMIEHSIDNKKEKVKIDKKSICMQIYAKVFGALNGDILKGIEANIQYLWENDMIKKKKIWSIIKHSVMDWINRKILN